MTNFQRTASRSALAAFLMFGAMSAAAFAGDLSRYRNFELGSHLATVAKQAAADPSQAKVIDSRPALIQELEWCPQPLGASFQTESVQEVLFLQTNLKPSDQIGISIHREIAVAPVIVPALERKMTDAALLAETDQTEIWA